MKSLYITSNDVKGLIVFLFVVLFVVSLRYITKLLFIPKRKRYIFNEIKRIFKGKLNYFGNPEIQIQDKNLLIDYSFENGYEYIIAFIDISQIDRITRKNLETNFEIVEKDNKIYTKVHCSWGYKGIKFKKRINEKLIALNKAIDEN